MGREIRRVPPDWEHPKDTSGNYIPLFDETHAEAVREFEKELLAWQDEPKDGYSFEEWHGTRPGPEGYRPEWAREPSCYQIYENVTEGTPVSPVFVSLDEMDTWLIEQGFSRKATSEFIKTGWAPSMVFVPGKGVSGLGIHSLDFLPNE